jgi:hypothetical protein
LPKAHLIAKLSLSSPWAIARPADHGDSYFLANFADIFFDRTGRGHPIDIGGHMYRLPTLGRLKGPQHRLLVPSLLRTLRASGDATHCSSCYQTSVIAAADENLPLGVRASMMTSNELGFVCPFCGEYNAGKRNDDANLERFFRAEGIGGWSVSHAF